MASDESMTVRSCISSVQEEEFDREDDIEGGDFYQPHHYQYQYQYHCQYHPHNKYFSRLSVCTATPTDDPEKQAAGTNPNHIEDDPEDHNVMGMYHMMSGLSIESFDGDDGDVEDELSDSRFKPTKKGGLGHHHDHMGLVITSDSDEESGGGCYSLPATPPRRMRPSGSAGRNHRRRRSGDAGKECVSENEAAADRSRRRRKRRVMRETLLRDTNKFREEETILTMEMQDNPSHERSQRVAAVVVGDDDDIIDEDDDEHNSKCSSTGGESQSESSSLLPMVVRPKGGKRSLRMDLDEVKACRELGFELETPLPLPLPLHTTTVPNNLSADTASTATTSGGNSPVHWRISSPGWFSNLNSIFNLLHDVINKLIS